MSTKYPGGLITKNPVTPAGPYETGAAPGVWTVEQALQYTKQGIWPTAGNVPNYIEDVFSTYLYTGNGSTQTITNGIDLSGKGGLVWVKTRSNAYASGLTDSARGVNKELISSQNVAEYNNTISGTTYGISAFNNNGFSLNGDYPYDGSCNNSGSTYASWTFRKQPKFFDVVTYVGNGSSTATVSHNLGSVPACVICKATSTTGNWGVWHRGNGTTAYSSFGLDSASAGTTDTQFSAFTSTTFKPYVVNNINSHCNQNGVTYVAYLFAHDAGGFGLTGTDNVISCGSFTTDGSGKATVNLGYEPQWLLMKNADGTDYNWVLMDTMRRWTANTASSEASLYPNTSDAETVQSFGSPTATGFNASGWYAGQTIIYIAIRRGPMKVPTSGTSVFEPIATSATTGTAITTNFPVDLQFWGDRGGNGYNFLVSDRLRGVVTSPVNATNSNLQTAVTAAEITIFNSTRNWNNTGYQIGSSLSGVNAAYWNFKRAPSFFDEVCYTGTGSNTTFSHNLGAVPELMIVKNRSSAGYGWLTYSATLGATKYLQINSTAAEGTVSTYWNNTAPTSSVFSVGTAGATNASGDTFVAYLFATCAGVSKVGSYTGNGTTQTINCGFTGGARFVLIKRTDSTGDWYVYDTARGMTVLTDPYLLLNSTAAESATLGSVTTVSTGFAVNASILAAINTNAASYIFLAIA